MASNTSNERAVYLSSRRDAAHVRSRPNAINNNANGGSGSRRKAEPRSNGSKSTGKSTLLSNAVHGWTYVLSFIAVAMIIMFVLYTNLHHHEWENQSSSLGQYATWEEAPASLNEFDHDNVKSVCRLPILTVEEWEAGRYWEREVPVIVKNVTDAWPALEHWTKKELLRRYPDVMVGMGRSKDLGQTGPDDAGDALTKTTIRDFVVNHMHDTRTEKYVFDRKLNMPDGLLEDCQPYPMPTRMFAENRNVYEGTDTPERLMWKDHLALTIGRDLQGLTFHKHNAAWNTVVFGAKRWILYDAERITKNITRLKRMTRDVNNPIQLTSPEWIRTLYHKDERMEEIRNYGHDCVQRAGEMLYVPWGWAHMVINIGDTVAVVSERGLNAMEP